MVEAPAAQDVATSPGQQALVAGYVAELAELRRLAAAADSRADTYERELFKSEEQLKHTQEHGAQLQQQLEEARTRIQTTSADVSRIADANSRQQRAEQEAAEMRAIVDTHETSLRKITEQAEAAKLHAASLENELLRKTDEHAIEMRQEAKIHAVALRQAQQRFDQELQLSKQQQQQDEHMKDQSGTVENRQAEAVADLELRYKQLLEEQSKEILQMETEGEAALNEVRTELQHCRNLIAQLQGQPVGQAFDTDSHKAKAENTGRLKIIVSVESAVLARSPQPFPSAGYLQGSSTEFVIRASAVKTARQQDSDTQDQGVATAPGGEHNAAAVAEGGSRRTLSEFMALDRLLRSSCPQVSDAFRGDASKPVPQQGDIVTLPHIPADCALSQRDAQRKMLDSWLKAAAVIAPVQSSADFLRFVGLSSQMSAGTPLPLDLSGSQAGKTDSGNAGDSVSRRLILEPVESDSGSLEDGYSDNKPAVAHPYDLQQQLQQQLELVARERESLQAQHAERSAALQSKERAAEAATQRAERAEALLSTLSRAIGTASDADMTGPVGGGEEQYEALHLMQHWVDSGGATAGEPVEEGVPMLRGDARATAWPSFEQQLQQRQRSLSPLSPAGGAVESMQQAYTTITTVDPRSLLSPAAAATVEMGRSLYGSASSGRDRSGTRRRPAFGQ